MQNHAQNSHHPRDYWSTSYKGQHIAIHRHHRGWLVYLNPVMQNKLVFCDPRSAANWLRRTVDQNLAYDT
jgi:hypothetical protein